MGMAVSCVSNSASASRRCLTNWRSEASCAAAWSLSAASSARHSRATASRPMPASKAARTTHRRCKAATSNTP